MSYCITDDIKHATMVMKIIFGLKYVYLLQCYDFIEVI